MDRAGQDATEDFEDVGHSADARKKLEEFEVGELPPSERKKIQETRTTGGSSNGLVIAIVVVLLAVGVGYYMTFMQ